MGIVNNRSRVTRFVENNPEQGFRFFGGLLTVWILSWLVKTQATGVRKTKTNEPDQTDPAVT
jgi:hypothetical protein